MADALQQLAHGDTTIGGEGCISLIIDIQSMGTATTEANTELSSLLAQTQRHNQVLQALQVAIPVAV